MLRLVASSRSCSLRKSCASKTCRQLQVWRPEKMMLFEHYLLCIIAEVTQLLQTSYL